MHNPEDSAGSQLAMVVALKLLMTPYRGNSQAIAEMELELEHMRALLLASPGSDRKLNAFNETAEALLAVIRPN